MNGVSLVDLTWLTTVLLGVVGAVVILLSFWLLYVGKISLTADPGGNVLEAGIPHVVAFKTRAPALGLLILGFVSMLVAAQLAQQAAAAADARKAAEEQRAIAAAERRLREEAQQWVVIEGKVKADDATSVTG